MIDEHEIAELSVDWNKLPQEQLSKRRREGGWGSYLTAHLSATISVTDGVTCTIESGVTTLDRHSTTLSGPQ